MIYSSSEQTVGRWIDGKTVFRKVIIGSNIVNANMGTFDKIIKATMIIKKSNGEWRNVPWLFAGFYIKQDGGAIVFQFGQDIKPTSYWHLIVEYTKN